MDETEIEPDDWKVFCDYIIRENRFNLSERMSSFVKTVVQTAAARVTVLAEGQDLWRARVGYHEDEKTPGPFIGEQIGAPPSEKARAGRANPERISYLYLASDMNTAVAEVRSWVGQKVSVARFRSLRQLTVVDATKDIIRGHIATVESRLGNASGGCTKSYWAGPPGQLAPRTADQILWAHINDAFSIPVADQDDEIGYLPTQFLAERLKIAGYDGIAYKSALNEEGLNYVLFDPSVVRGEVAKVVIIKGIKHVIDESRCLWVTFPAERSSGLDPERKEPSE